MGTSLPNVAGVDSSSAARLLLRVKENATKREISSAFADLLFRAHPDTGGNDPAMIAKLKQARDYLLRQANNRENDCKLCKGWGYIHGVKCSACNQE